MAMSHTRTQVSAMNTLAIETCSGSNSPSSSADAAWYSTSRHAAVVKQQLGLVLVGHVVVVAQDREAWRAVLHDHGADVSSTVFKWRRSEAGVGNEDVGVLAAADEDFRTVVAVGFT